MDGGSVTVWLARVKAGDRDAAVEALWGRYFGRLVGMARGYLRGRPRPAADEEDVALDALNSFVRAAAAGRFPRLGDRDDLCQVLLVLVARKAADVAAAEGAAKRGGGWVVPVSQRVAGADGSGPQVGADDPDPAGAAAVAEAVDRLLAALGDELRRVAVWRLEGYTNAEIGEKLGRAVPTVERKLERIRDAWAAASGAWCHGAGVRLAGATD